MNLMRWQIQPLAAHQQRLAANENIGLALETTPDQVRDQESMGIPGRLETASNTGEQS
jgi:hypothetical protein